MMATVTISTAITTARPANETAELVCTCEPTQSASSGAPVKRLIVRAAVDAASKTRLNQFMPWAGAPIFGRDARLPVPSPSQLACWGRHSNPLPGVLKNAVDLGVPPGGRNPESVRRPAGGAGGRRACRARASRSPPGCRFTHPGDAPDADA